MIVNMNIGKLGKNRNLSAVTKIFKNASDAELYKQQNGGDYFRYNFYETQQTETNENYRLYAGINNDDDDDNDNQHINYNTKDIITNTIYYHIRSSESELSQGFLPIQHMIYDMLRVNMYEKYQQYKNEYKIIGINTDSIFIENKFDFVNIDKNSYENIGKTYFEIKIPPNNLVVDKYPENTIQIKNKVERIEIKIDDEFDTESINEQLEKISNCIILGDVPGSGKTTLLMNYIKYKNHILTTPYNLQAAEFKEQGYEAKTLYKLMGLRITENGETENSMKQGNDFEDVEVVVFDELFSHGTYNLNLVNQFMKEHTHIQFFASGDVSQLPPIENINNVQDIDEYYNNIIYSLFPNSITLKINKRHKKEQAQKLKDIKKDLFSDVSIRDIIKKYNLKTFSDKSDVKGFSVCYYNETVEQVNQIKQNLISPPKNAFKINDICYWKGLQMRAKNYMKIGKFTVNTNYTYTISEITNKLITLHDSETKEKFDITISQFVSSFSLPYAGTGHSVQGLTKDSAISIFNAFSDRICPKWFWVALTRNRDLNEVYIYDPKHYEHNVIKNLNMKIASYMSADLKNNRSYIKEDFISPKWVEDSIKQQKSCCNLCKCTLSLNYNNNDPNQYSIDRIDSNIAHIKSNCQILCLKCNVRKNKH